MTVMKAVILIVLISAVGQCAPFEAEQGEANHDLQVHGQNTQFKVQVLNDVAIKPNSIYEGAHLSGPVVVNHSSEEEVKDAMEEEEEEEKEEERDDGEPGFDVYFLAESDEAVSEDNEGTEDSTTVEATAYNGIEYTPFEDEDFETPEEDKSVPEEPTETAQEFIYRESDIFLEPGCDISAASHVYVSVGSLILYTAALSIL